MGYSHVNHRNFGKPARLETFSRNILIVLNTVFVVFGFILFVYGIGGKTSTNRNSYVEITENGGDIFQFTSNVLIILGVISLFLGLWGLSGIHTYCKAAIYISLLVFLIFTDVFWSKYAYSLESSARVAVENNLLSTIEKVKNTRINPNSTLMTTLQHWDALQSELKCCGVYEYRDWYLPNIISRVDHNDEEGKENGEGQTEDDYGNVTASSHANHYPTSEDFLKIRQSCFKNGDDGMADGDYNNPVNPELILENVFTDGCLEKTVIDLDIDRMQRVGVLMAFFKSLAVIFAAIVTCHLRRDKVIFSQV